LKAIAIIPARGGSKGIPRKNLRPVAGKPMLFYSIRACLSSVNINKVFVTTDDDEIALFAERFGAEVIMRQTSLADDITPLDPVIHNALVLAEKSTGEQFDIIVTVQPTSPLIQSHDIDSVVNKFLESDFDTVQTVVDDRHLCWTIKDSKALPLYEKRVNRQLLPKNYRETGAVIACTRSQIKKGSRIGSNVGLVEMPQNRSFDIDNFSDLFLCEAMLNRKKIIFTVIGYAEVGLGHAFRAVMLAHELVNYDLVFICEKKNDLAIKYIQSNNYEVSVCENGSLTEAVLEQTPDIVINDILDTEETYITALKASGIIVVNFEDLGSGHLCAHLVVNALYPDAVASKHVLTGEKYFCVRDEFLYIEKKIRSQHVNKVLLTFGGVDEGDLTTRVLSSISAACIENEIEVIVVLGPGFQNSQSLDQCLQTMNGLKINVYHHTKRISDLMREADIAITSGGRTVLELASLEVPTIVICQNTRETTHTFASKEKGILNLGHRDNISDSDILSSFNQVLSDESLRNEMSDNMAALDLTLGKQRVINKIVSLIK
tara:strand:+ start:2887 stop:4524 length:1638 start_codon:yes stop_codon:yes gene_type:complete